MTCKYQDKELVATFKGTGGAFSLFSIFVEVTLKIITFKKKNVKQMQTLKKKKLELKENEGEGRKLYIKDCC